MTTHRGITLAAIRDDEGLVEVIENADSRTLYFGSRARQSCMLLHDPVALPLGYTRSMLAALLFCPQPVRVLMIGLGGGSQARYLLHHFPACQIDCVEARASVVEVAKRYFKLPDDPRLNIRVGDGADIIRSCPQQHYDIILIDAFDSDGINDSVCNSHFYFDCYATLTQRGVLAVNLWVTPNADCKNLLDIIGAGFSGQILRLPVERHANLVVLGLATPQTHKDLRKLHVRAKQMGPELGLDLVKYLRSLINNNSGMIRRYLDLRWYW